MSMQFPDRPDPVSFSPGEAIPVSGVYRVFHAEHRIPHEVTLLRTETFPQCTNCGSAVSFELVRAIPRAEDGEFRVRLYTIPHLEADAA